MTKKKPAREQAEKHLPKSAPKKTGKRGVGPAPLDSVADFDTLVKKEEQVTAEPLKVPGTRKPRQPRLPEMEDPEIEELENAAQDYADVRDQRMELTPEENRLKLELLALMKKYKREHYHRDGVDIKVVTEKETVKVKFSKESE